MFWCFLLGYFDFRIVWWFSFVVVLLIACFAYCDTGLWMEFACLGFCGWLLIWCWWCFVWFIVRAYLFNSVARFTVLFYL